MKITKIVFEDYKKDITKPKAICSVVLDDSLKLNGVRLYRNEGGYYLVFPSCEDIYQKVESINPNVEISFPECIYGKEKKKDYEEFYHPLCKSLYETILHEVVKAYDILRKTGNHAYIITN